MNLFFRLKNLVINKKDENFKKKVFIIFSFYFLK